MRRFLTYIHTSSTRECFAYLILSFALTWSVWIPVLLTSRRYEQLGDLLIIGTFGPSVAAILLSYRGIRVTVAVRSRSTGNRNNATACQTTGLGTKSVRIVARIPPSHEKAVETIQAGMADSKSSDSFSLNEGRSSSHNLACPIRTAQHSSNVKPKQTNREDNFEPGTRTPR